MNFQLKDVDVGLWSVLLNNDLVFTSLSLEMSDVQNKDSKNIYSASMKKYKEQNRSLSNIYSNKEIKNE